MRGKHLADILDDVSQVGKLWVQIVHQEMKNV